MSSLNQQIADEGVNATASSLNDSRTGWKVLAGIPLDEVLAFEASYVDLGDVSARISGSTTHLQNFFNGIEGIQPSTASGVNLGFKWGYHPYDMLELNTRVGIFVWDADYQLTSTLGSRDVNAHGMDISLGLGVSYNINSMLAVRLDGDRYRIEGEDVNMWSMGVQYSFD